LPSPSPNTQEGVTEFIAVKPATARALESMPRPNTPALPPPASPDEVRSRVDAYLAKLGDSNRAPKLRAVFNA